MIFLHKVKILYYFCLSFCNQTLIDNEKEMKNRGEYLKFMI